MDACYVLDFKMYQKGLLKVTLVDSQALQFQSCFMYKFSCVKILQAQQSFDKTCWKKVEKSNFQLVPFACVIRREKLARKKSEEQVFYYSYFQSTNHHLPPFFPCIWDHTLSSSNIGNVNNTMFLLQLDLNVKESRKIQAELGCLLFPKSHFI